MLYNDLIEYKDLQRRIAYLEFKSQLEKSNQEAKTVLEDMQDKQARLHKVVDSFSQPCRDIFKLKYFEGKSLKEVAIITAYSYNHVRRIHSSMIQTIKELDPYIKY